MTDQSEMIVTTSGFLVADIIAADLPKLASPGELVFAPRGIQVRVGGHAANIAIDLRQLGLPRGQVSVAGAVGRDLFGDLIERTLQDRGIVAHLERLSLPTNKNVILVLKGEDRRFHAEMGASLDLDPGRVKTVVRKERPFLFYIATGLERKLDPALLEVLKEAKGRGCLTFVDIAPKPYGKNWDFLLPAFEHADIFHCNDVELMSIVKKSRLSEALESLIGLGVRMAVISLGPKGAIIETKRVRIRQGSFGVRVVDPTGAGDALCAGIISELVRVRHKIPREDVGALTPGRLSKILLAGQSAGAACVTAIGTTTAVTSPNVRGLIRKQGARILASAKIVT